MPRILVFDGQSIYRTGLHGLINAEMPWAEVIEANNPNQALAQIRAGAFDLTLVGTDRARLGSLDFLKLAREAELSTRFAVISGRSNDQNPFGRIATCARCSQSHRSRLQSSEPRQFDRTGLG